MAFSVSPEKIIEIFLAGKNKKLKELFEYLDSIAITAKELADIWQGLYAEVIEVNYTLEDTDELQKRANYINHLLMFINKGKSAHLMKFYELLSTAAGNKIDSFWLHQFTDKLAEVIQGRNLLKKSFEQVMNQISKQVFIDSTIVKEDMKELSTLVSALQREAATLQVLSKTIRTVYS